MKAKRFHLRYVQQRVQGFWHHAGFFEGTSTWQLLKLPFLEEIEFSVVGRVVNLETLKNMMARKTISFFEDAFNVRWIFCRCKLSDFVTKLFVADFNFRAGKNMVFKSFCSTTDGLSLMVILIEEAKSRLLKESSKKRLYAASRKSLCATIGNVIGRRQTS